MKILMKTFYGLIITGTLAIVIGGKFPVIGKHFVAMEPAGQYAGDLYRLCELDRFREPITVFAPTPTALLEQAEILTLGDSFFNSSLESDLFANELAKKGKLTVHNLESSTFFEPYSYPLSYLQTSSYRPGRRRILILESAERISLDRTGSYLANAGASANNINSLAFKFLKNNDVEFFFKNNVIIHPAIKQLKNIRFNWFGGIDRAIGAYSLQPDMLFYQRDLEFAALPKPSAVLDLAADRVARLAAILRSQYNIELLYVVIPDKYSVYRDYLPLAKKYDLYIPRLVNQLRQRGVHAVDLYTAYSERRRSIQSLYFASDTHYTAAGKAILVDECLREITFMNSGSQTPVGLSVKQVLQK